MNSSISRWLSSRGRGVTLSNSSRSVDHHLPFRQIEVEGAAGGPGGEQGAKCGIEVRQWQAEIVARVVRLLHLLVGEARRAAHEAAAETVGLLAAAGVDPQFDEQTAAVLVAGAGCTSRWTAPRAASARRGRGKYTLLPRVRAAWSSAEPGCT